MKSFISTLTILFSFLLLTHILEAQQSLPSLHLTVVLHNEEPGSGRPDYTADPNFYLQNRQLVKLLAETITSKGASLNFQSDWNYVKAVAMYDTGDVTTN